MTIHAAKGLEFNNVFITGLEEGLFPMKTPLTDTEGLEEERRLMYVAITRARKRLHLTFSQTRMLHGQTRYNIKSRFLEELPESCLKWLTPQNQGFGSGFAKAYQDSWASGRAWARWWALGLSLIVPKVVPGYGGAGGGYGQRGSGQYYGGVRKEESFKDLTAPIPKAMAQPRPRVVCAWAKACFTTSLAKAWC